MPSIGWAVPPDYAGGHLANAVIAGVANSRDFLALSKSEGRGAVELRAERRPRHRPKTLRIGWWTTGIEEPNDCGDRCVRGNPPDSRPVGEIEVSGPVGDSAEVDPRLIRRSSIAWRDS